jgi:hypothetical protein
MIFLILFQIHIQLWNPSNYQTKVTAYHGDSVKVYQFSSSASINLPKDTYFVLVYSTGKVGAVIHVLNRERYRFYARRHKFKLFFT